MSILVIAEHDNSSLKPATLNAVSAALQLGDEIDILLAGANCAGAAEAASKVAGVANVLVADNAVYEHQLAENVSLLVAGIGGQYTHILAPSTTTGKNLLPRVAALLDVAQISDIIAVESADTFKHPIYAGNIIETISSSDPIKVITVRTTAFDLATAEGGSAAIQPLDAVHDSALASFVGEEMAVSDRPELTSASVVISGGRGMQNGENFHLLEKVADKLGAAVGASRAAVDAGFVPNDMQVGQTGKIVAPELYIGRWYFRSDSASCRNERFQGDCRYQQR